MDERQFQALRASAFVLALLVAIVPSTADAARTTAKELRGERRTVAGERGPRWQTTTNHLRTAHPADA